MVICRRDQRLGDTKPPGDAGKKRATAMSAVRSVRSGMRHCYLSGPSTFDAGAAEAGPLTDRMDSPVPPRGFTSQTGLVQCRITRGVRQNTTLTAPPATTVAIDLARDVFRLAYRRCRWPHRGHGSAWGDRSPRCSDNPHRLHRDGGLRLGPLLGRRFLRPGSMAWVVACAMTCGRTYIAPRRIAPMQPGCGIWPLRGDPRRAGEDGRAAGDSGACIARARVPKVTGAADQPARGLLREFGVVIRRALPGATGGAAALEDADNDCRWRARNPARRARYGRGRAAPWRTSKASAGVPIATCAASAARRRRRPAATALSASVWASSRLPLPLATSPASRSASRPANTPAVPGDGSAGSPNVAMSAHAC